MQAFLSGMVRRLRLVWAVAFTGWIAPAVVGVALALVLTGWLVPWGWFEPAAVAVVLGALLAIIAVAIFRPLSRIRAARSADRGLHTDDAFGAAVEFADLDDAFGHGIRERAETLAATSSAKNAAPLPILRGRWAIAVAIGAVALVMGLVTNPQDEVRADRAAANEFAEELARDLEQEADELDEPATAEVSAALDQLAEELKGAQSFEEIAELLSETERDLGERSPNFAAERAAAEGLERSLETNPLAGSEAGSSAADQMAQAAAGLEGLSNQEQQDLAERLDQIADSQQSGDPETADALREAAEQLRAGNTAGAQAALGEAAAAQAANASAVAGQVAAGQAAQGLAQRQQQAAAAQQGQQGEGQGEGAGEGSGEGAGEGAGQGSGEGSGEGSGQGQGQGGGQGQGAGQGGGQGGNGGASGQVGGAAGGSGSGQGGVGNPGGTDQPDVDGNNSGGSIVDPNALASGDPLDLGGSLSGNKPGEVLGQADGPTRSGGSQIPLSDVIGEYSNRATNSAQRSQLPPRQQQLVGSYFDQLSQL